MIALSTLATQLEEKLNDAAETSELLNGGIATNVKYRFHVMLDTDVFKGDEREGNTVYSYINCIMTANGSDVDGVTEGAYNATLQTSVEILVPFIHCRGNSETEALLLYAVRDLLGNVLQVASGNEVQDGEILFYEGVKYSIPLTGDREQRGAVGDSISLNLSIDYFFIAMGVGSGRVRFEFSADGEHFSPILYTKAGMARSTIQDSATFSSDAESGLPSAKATPSGTGFTIRITAPTRISLLDAYIARYTLFGDCTPCTIRVYLPTETQTNDGKVTVKDPVPVDYLMIPTEASIDAELDYNAATTYTFVESSEVEL